MKRLLLITILTQLVLFISCKNTTKPEPAYNPNECTEYYCPAHKDKTSISQDQCPECKNPMVLHRLNADTLIPETQSIQSICDSFECYQTQILLSSKKLMDLEPQKKEAHQEQILLSAETFLKSINAHENIVISKTDKQKEKYREHLLTVKQNQAAATLYLKAMNDEIKKENPDYAKIKNLAKKLHDATEKISKESSYLKEH